MRKVEYIEDFVQALNYLTSLGWKYEGNIGLSNSTNVEVKILFSRDFNPAELTEGQ